jgi:hypothetical protein
MNNKLFNIPAVAIERVYVLETYHGNRIAVKLMRLLKAGNVYKVKRLKSKNDLTIFEISLKSKEHYDAAFKRLIAEIFSYVPDNFPPNYLFWVGDNPLGSVASFKIGKKGDSYSLSVSHKIKEINKSSVMPTQQIFMSQ